MVLVGDVDVVAGPDVVADLDREVADDATPLADQAAVADATTRSDRHRWPGTMPADRRDLRPDHRAGPDVDVALVDDRGRREADDAALAEGAEAPAPAAVGADGAELDHAVPCPAHQLAGRPAWPHPAAVDDRGVGPHPLEHGRGGYRRAVTTVGRGGCASMQAWLPSARLAADRTVDTHALVVTGGHGFDEPSFAALLAALPASPWSASPTRTPTDRLHPDRLHADVVVLYDLPGLRARPGSAGGAVPPAGRGRRGLGGACSPRACPSSRSTTASAPGPRGHASPTSSAACSSTPPGRLAGQDWPDSGYRHDVPQASPSSRPTIRSAPACRRPSRSSTSPTSARSSRTP